MAVLTYSPRRACGVEENLDFRLGDGLSVLEPGEADVIVIAGMGGAFPPVG